MQVFLSEEKVASKEKRQPEVRGTHSTRSGKEGVVLSKMLGAAHNSRFIRKRVRDPSSKQRKKGFDPNFVIRSTGRESNEQGFGECFADHDTNNFKCNLVLEILSRWC